MKLEALSQSDIGDKPHTVPYNGILFGHGWNIDNDVWHTGNKDRKRNKGQDSD